MEVKANGRFGHHPDQAIDFEVEVGDLEAEIYHHKVGFQNGTPSLEEIKERISRAMTFRVGAVETCVKAKQRLRELETEAANLTIIPHVHDEIPADIMKAATEIAYSAETGVVVGSFPGAVYIARAILAERQRFVAEFDGAADAALPLVEAYLDVIKHGTEDTPEFRARMSADRVACEALISKATA